MIETVSYVVAILLGLPPIVYGIWKGMVYFHKASNEVKGLFRTLKLLDYEFRPNSGTSLTDKINRIDQNTQLIRHQQRAYHNEGDTQCGVMEADKKGRVVWCNTAFKDMVELETEDIVGLGWINAVHEKDREKVVSEYHHAITQQRDIFLDFRLTRPATRTAKAKLTGRIIRNDLGVMLGILLFVKANDNVGNI